MITPISISLILLLNVGAMFCEGWGWMKQDPHFLGWAKRLAQATLIGLVLSLFWQIVEQSHLPPIGLGQTTSVLATLLLYQHLRYRHSLPSGHHLPLGRLSSRLDGIWDKIQAITKPGFQQIWPKVNSDDRLSSILTRLSGYRIPIQVNKSTTSEFDKRELIFDTSTNAGIWLFSLGLICIILSSSTYAMWTTQPHQGLEVLWFWALVARWLILIGLAGVSWLAIFAVLNWLHLDLKWTTLKKHLPFNQAEAEIAISRLTVIIMPTLLLGSVLFLGRKGWGWGGLEQERWLLVLMIYLTAAWWMQFAWPVRPRLLWVLRLLAFVISVPVLGIISVSL